VSFESVVVFVKGFCGKAAEKRDVQMFVTTKYIY
jgi:hypothetical protein